MPDVVVVTSGSKDAIQVGDDRQVAIAGQGAVAVISVGVQGPAGVDGSGDIDGGTAESVFAPGQVIDGGAA